MYKLLTASLLATVALAAGHNGLIARQVSSCESHPGYKTCKSSCIPVTYSCCAIGEGGCEPGTYCTDDGCCPIGEICTGPGGTLTGTLTDTITNTLTNTVTNTLTNTHTETAAPTTTTTTEEGRRRH